jgi:hypothetical protein
LLYKNNLVLLLTTLLSLTSSISKAQSYNVQSLRVTKTDLTNNTYEKDTTANAFYIYETGYSRYEKDADFNIVTDYEAKIKILNKKGYNNATVKIYLSKSDRKKEKLSNIKATTYFLKNDNIVTAKLLPSYIFTEENKDYDIVSFTFPSLAPGAVLTYSFTKESPFVFNFETWYFQEDIPKAYSKFEIKIPGNYIYNIKKIGNKKLDSQENDIVKNCINFSSRGTPADCNHAVYIITDIPAFIEEDFLSSRQNFINRIEFELSEVIQLDGFKQKYTKTWDAVDKEIKHDKSIGRQLRKSSLINDVLPTSIKSMPNNLEKATDIYNYVKNNYKWNGDYKIFYDVNLRELLDEKSGNISSLNILLHNLYKEEGFKVKPVLSSTRKNGLLTKLYPVLTEFNYLTVQLQLDGTPYLLDASEKYLPFGELPFRALNSYARLIDLDGDSQWIDVKATEISGLRIIDSISIKADGTSIGHSEHIFKGIRAIDVRDGLDQIKEENIFGELSNPNEQTRSIGVAFYNKDLIDKKVSIEYDLANTSQKINDHIYFNPFSFKFFESNPFKLTKRTYPIDFGYKQSFIYSINVTLPENHSVIELPKNKLIKLPDNTGALIFVVQQLDDSKLRIQCRINLTEPSYPTEFYPYLKEFVATLMSIQNSSYIIIKENS